MVTFLPTSGEEVEPILDTVSTADAGGAFGLLWLVVAIPAVMAALLLVLGRRSNAWGHLAAVAAVLASFVIGLVLVVQLAGLPEDGRNVVLNLWEWTFAGQFSADMALRLDPLSAAFVLLITGVGALIHIYSIGYMHDDPDRRKFFAFLNLFVAAMLLLVLANNYLLLYVGWEGVGLASYLLIGFWQFKPSAAVAAKKAFIVNRVGDAGLSIAIMLMFATFGSVTFDSVFAAAEEADGTVLTLIGLTLLLAACGKSAQFPLQSWLLDAMEGPTPVSALIHAATMVTAGVYLIARSNAIFDLSAAALTAVAVVGTITMLMGAAIASAKDPIKKSLAGSTMSQIGYMILAVGLGPVGYVFALFHLLTHGVFKAGLFLGAGSVMHGMKNEEDMRRYGALRGFMVVTFGAFFVAYLAIIGVPPFAGFFSKDEIIKVAMEVNPAYGIAALVGAGLTAFYMTRMVIMTFFGKARWDDDQHPHESPPSMTVPMIILGIGSVLAGVVLLFVLDIEGWLAPVVGFAEPERLISSAILIPLTLLVVAVGVGLAYRQYAQHEVPRTAPSAVSPLTKAARNDLYGDAFNEAVFMRPGLYLTRWLVWFDSRGIDGAVRGIASMFSALSGKLRGLQTGFARQYAMTMVGGALLITGVLVVVRLV
jgi:NADH-quinone oxidoreductase subunit L